MRMTCETCGGRMLGDAATEVLHCEHATVPDGVEVNARPIYCGGPAEYEAALRRAFVEKRAACVVISSRRQQFQIRCTNYGIEQGWLKGRWDDSDEQSTAFVARLTDEGRTHFGLEQPHA
jgi:hypothetical protein